MCRGARDDDRSALYMNTLKGGQTKTLGHYLQVLPPSALLSTDAEISAKPENHKPYQKYRSLQLLHGLFGSYHIGLH